MNKIINYLKGFGERFSDILYVICAILQFVIGCVTFLCAAIFLATWAAINLVLLLVTIPIACALHIPFYLLFNLQPIEIASKIWEKMYKAFYTFGDACLDFFNEYVFPAEINWYEKLEDWVWKKLHVDIKIDK